MDDYRLVFPTRLNEARKRTSLSKVNFAMKLTEEVNKLMASAPSHDPSHGALTVEALYAAASLCGVSTDYLLGLSDDPKKV